jgi:hypothetical protein
MQEVIFLKVKKFLVLSIILLLIIQLTGCGQEKSSAKEIAPIDRDKITVMTITYGNKDTKEFTDIDQINALIDYLDNIKFSKMSIKQEEEVFDNGKIFNLDSTFSIQVRENKHATSEANIILISEEKLVLPDTETTRNSRTISYINQDDNSSLKAVKEIYSLAKKVMD